MAYRSVVLNTPALNTLLRSPSGKVGRYFGTVGRAVTIEAKELASDRVQQWRADGYHSRFKTTTVPGPQGFKVVVSNDASTGGDNPRSLAAIIESGSRPHVILPRRARMLAFVAQSGEQVFAGKVNHPGTKAQHIMRDALRRVLARPAGQRGR